MNRSAAIGFYSSASLINLPECSIIKGYSSVVSRTLSVEEEAEVDKYGVVFTVSETGPFRGNENCLSNNQRLQLISELKIRHGMKTGGRSAEFAEEVVSRVHTEVLTCH